MLVGEGGVEFSVASLIVPDFTIYFDGSSCNYLFFCLLLTPLRCFYNSVAYPRQNEMPRNDRETKEVRIKPKKGENCMNCHMYRNGKIWDYETRLK